MSLVLSLCLMKMEWYSLTQKVGGHDRYTGSTHVLCNSQVITCVSMQCVHVNKKMVPLVFQVQGEIEQLRVSQAEKLLQLKEAATRRKLQELKQQLLHSNTALVSPGPSDQQHSLVPRTPTIPHSQSVVQSYPHSTTPGNESMHYTYFVCMNGIIMVCFMY